jgi:hypothetical protein
MFPRAKLRVEPALLEFAEHEMSASETRWNARRSVCLFRSVCDLAHPWTSLTGTRQKRNSVTVAWPATGKLTAIAAGSQRA